MKHQKLGRHGEAEAEIIEAIIRHPSAAVRRAENLGTLPQNSPAADFSF
jgi:hypothetical protein